MKIIKAHKIPSKNNEKLGQIVKSNKKEILVGTKGGYLSLDIVHIGSWGIFDSDDFYDIFTPEVGEILE